jgi:hypothetical protein
MSSRRSASPTSAFRPGRTASGTSGSHRRVTGGPRATGDTPHRLARTGQRRLRRSPRGGSSVLG